MKETTCVNSWTGCVQYDSRDDISINKPSLSADLECEVVSCWRQCPRDKGACFYTPISSRRVSADSGTAVHSALTFHP